MLTLAPCAKQQFFDNAGAVLAGGFVYTYAAGTDTPQATYADADGLVANANPIELDDAGRVPSGFFLLASAYKFVVADADDVTLWSQDDIQPVPASSADTVVNGVAGEAISAGECCYLSDGSGSLTAGSWYRSDADNNYSSTLPQIGFAVSDIASGASGLFLIVGRVTGLSGLTVGADYFVSATPGEITTTEPALSRKVGVADSLTSIVMTANPPSSAAFTNANNILANRVFN